jgi:hypothetical protein
MDVTVEIKGLAELDARLQEIGALASQKLLRRVLRKVAKPLLDRATQNAQGVAKSGALAASMKTVLRREKGAQVAAVAVTSKGRERTAVYVHNAYYQRKRKGIFYGWMLDRGHRVGSRKSAAIRERQGRPSQGTVGPRPWFTPAVSASTGQMTSDFVKVLTAAITRIEKRKSKTANADGLVSE